MVKSTIYLLLSFSFATVILLHFTYAQVPFPHQCPEVKLLTEFDLDGYMGIWYEYSKYPFVFEVGKKCMYARYGNNGNNTISVVNAAINRITGAKSQVRGSAKVLGPGELAVMFSARQSTDKPNYIVLGTDYSSYAVVYSCSNFTTVAHTKVVWILTRERLPTTSAISAAKKVMDDNNLTQTFLIDTVQSGCPAVEGGDSDTVADGTGIADNNFADAPTDRSNIIELA